MLFRSGARSCFKRRPPFLAVFGLFVTAIIRALQGFCQWEKNARPEKPLWPGNKGSCAEFCNLTLNKMQKRRLMPSVGAALVAARGRGQAPPLRSSHPAYKPVRRGRYGVSPRRRKAADRAAPGGTSNRGAVAPLIGRFKGDGGREGGKSKPQRKANVPVARL